jgi:hypothetical protein
MYSWSKELFVVLPKLLGSEQIGIATPKLLRSELFVAITFAGKIH